MKRYILYSNIIWKQPEQNDNASSSKDSPGSSPEAANQPDRTDIDLVIQRGTVRDYVNKRVEKVIKNEKKQLFKQELKDLEETMRKSNEQIKKELEVQKKTNEKLHEHVELLEKEKARLDHDVASTSKRVTELENIEATNPEDVKMLESRLAALEEQEKASPEEIKTLREDFNDLVNDNSSLHKQLTSLLALPEQVNDLEEKIDRVGANPQVVKEFLVRITARMDRIEKQLGVMSSEPTPQPQPETEPEPSTSPGREKPHNEGYIDIEKQIKGIKATPMANKIYKALKDRMGPGWKFTASYHHAKCWKYYNVRPGNDVKGDTRGNTKEKYCIFDGNDYYYTEAWYKKLINELPTEWEKIKHYKPTN